MTTENNWPSQTKYTSATRAERASRNIIRELVQICILQISFSLENVHIHIITFIATWNFKYQTTFKKQKYQLTYGHNKIITLKRKKNQDIQILWGLVQQSSRGRFIFRGL